MTAYIKTTWTDEVPADSPVKYAITGDSEGEISASATIAPVTSITPGTAVNATNLNHLETGVYNAQNAADAAQADAETAQSSADAVAAIAEVVTLTIFMNGGDPLTVSDIGVDWIPEKYNGWVLTDAVGLNKVASSSGNITITVKKNGVSILTTNITIEASEKTSRTATTQPVINTANDDVATGDEIEIANSAPGTGVTFCGAQLEFTKP